MMSGFWVSIVARSGAFLFTIDWQFMTSTVSGVSLRSRGRCCWGRVGPEGEDAATGRPGLSMSERLERLLERLELVVECGELKKELRLGRPQFKQCQEMLLEFMVL